MWHWGDPRRLCVATANSPAVVAQTSFITLYNNSTGPHVLCLHEITADGNNPDFTEGWALTFGAVGGSPQPGMSVFSGEKVPVGQALVGAVATPPALLAAYSAPGALQGNTHLFPFAFLQPNWSITFYNLTQDKLGQYTFLYEWRYAWEFAVVDPSPTDG